MKKLDHADHFRLRAAEGWLELGDAASAHGELEEMAPAKKTHPAVLAVRCAIYLKEEKWNLAADTAQTLTDTLPEDPGGWIHFAYATRRKTGGGIPQAKAILLAAEPKFPAHFLFPFNLACYCSRLNELAEAECWLKKAIALDKVTVAKLAATDPDLKPLRDSLDGKLPG